MSEATGLTLLAMKILGGGAMAAVFFASSAQAADADPECTPDPFTLAAIVQTATVGLVARTQEFRGSSRAVLVRSLVSLGFSSPKCWPSCSRRRYWSGFTGPTT